MKITLQQITRENADAIMLLKADENLVANNMISMAEAFAYTMDKGVPPIVRAIYHEETPVGFVMVSYANAAESTEDTDVINNNGEPYYYLWRLMIDENHQNKGYGKAAMLLTLEEVKKLPLGEAKAFYTSVVMEEVNPVGANFYLSLGFEKTGEVLDPEGENEQVMRMTL
ncbi:MAG: GNAT family N-acetyltransferase [Defluviitaleaceae bacterium]|nr:GNAT family N-acetyltransferase [Defluviitaleaceae bacterium]